jgi:capsular exopolysaccharide synthesis family protein
VFRVENESTLSASEERKSVYSGNSSLVVLRSTPDCAMIVDTPQGAASEYFGMLRSRLLNARNKSDIRSVIITSPQKQDGKTFNSINLGISLGQLQQLRILLIDGDLRRSGITEILALQREPGLADFLQDWSPFENCVKATSLSHLYVVPSGNFSPESLPAILEGSRWPKFLEKAKEEFDLILVDSVPVSAPIADFELLFNACDSALLVVQVGKTERAALDITSTRMQGKLLGLIVNNKKLPNQFDYHSPSGGTRKE